MRKNSFQQVSDLEVYQDIFRLGKGYLQVESGERKNFKSNPIGVGMNRNRTFKRIMFDDTFEQSLRELQKAEFSILSGLSYFGKTNSIMSASKCYALIFDLDGVTEKSLNNFFFGMGNDVYPKPNYVALSGHGVHLYYVFDEPISLYPETKRLLKELKYNLTDLMWNKYTSEIKNKQFQGINQGFRVIGSKTKVNSLVRAFKVSDEHVTLDYLNSFLKADGKKIDFAPLYKETTMTLEQAKEKYPEWYERRILQKQTKGTWTAKRDLYDWWIRKVKGEASFGHRYYCIMVLSIYAMKCGIKYAELEKDALALIDELNSINADEPFTADDVYSALECYDERYKTFPIKDIEKITSIPIPKNKRNGRKQNQHMEVMRAIQSITNPEWRKGNGRPSKERLVKTYLKSNPTATPTEVARALNISRPTVYKYMK